MSDSFGLENEAFFEMSRVGFTASGFCLGSNTGTDAATFTGDACFGAAGSGCVGGGGERAGGAGGRSAGGGMSTESLLLLAIGVFSGTLLLTCSPPFFRAIMRADSEVCSAAVDAAVVGRGGRGESTGGGAVVFVAVDLSEAFCTDDCDGVCTFPLRITWVAGNVPISGGVY